MKIYQGFCTTFKFWHYFKKIPCYLVPIYRKTFPFLNLLRLYKSILRLSPLSEYDLNSPFNLLFLWFLSIHIDPLEWNNLLFPCLIFLLEFMYSILGIIIPLKLYYFNSLRVFVLYFNFFCTGKPHQYYRKNNIVCLYIQCFFCYIADEFINIKIIKIILFVILM